MTIVTGLHIKKYVVIVLWLLHVYKLFCGAFFKNVMFYNTIKYAHAGSLFLFLYLSLIPCYHLGVCFVAHRQQKQIKSRQVSLQVADETAMGKQFLKKQPGYLY